MSTNVSGRITLILCVLWACLSLIFPNVPPSLFWFLHPTQPISLRPDLKPGIDMVGGTSLVYEIKAPAEGLQTDLAEQVMMALKKRVDPDGVRNLIWRPQGNTRLEIQMPTSSRGKEIRELRTQFSDTQTRLEATNVRQAEAVYVVQNLKGDERAAELKRLAGGSATRGDVLGAMSATWDQLQAVEQKDAGKQAELEIQNEALIDRLNDTNLSATDFQRILDLPKPEDRAAGISDLKKKFNDFPARLATMDQFAEVYSKYSEVKGLIDDAGELKRLLRGSGVIEFHILVTDFTLPEYRTAIEQLQRRGPRYQSGDPVRWYEVERSKEVIDKVQDTILQLSRTDDPRQRNILIQGASDGNDRVENMFRGILGELNNPQAYKPAQKQIEDSLLIGHELEDYGGKKYALCYVTPDKAMVQREGQPHWALERAYPLLESGQRQVGFTFDTQGAIQFADLTGNNINRPLAIVLDDKLISAPNINSQISRSGVITGGGRGGFSTTELNYLVNTLNAGALPAQLTEDPISEQTVGPQLGADNLRAGLLASIIGLLAVAAFMIIYYHLSGVIAVIALLMNMIMILGVMAALNATWTLPAVAGIVLTIGMSVDANVLVFERLREEQHRGLSLRLALRNAYDQAASAIIDSNVVTAVTCVILYWMGSEEVKGFGLTLLIGLTSSLFTALFVTKTIFTALLNKYDLHHLGSLPETWPAFGKILHPNIEWMSKVKYFLTGSLAIIVVGLISIVAVARQGKLLDVEFSSGTSVEFELKQATPIEDVRKMLGVIPDSDLPSPSVVSVGDDRLKYQVVTASNDSRKVTDVILRTLAGKLNLLQPSRFDLVGVPYTDAMDKAIFPITPDTRVIAGVAPAAIKSHIGGVAVVLKDLNPQLKPEEIAERIRQVRLQPQAGGTRAGQYRPIDVEAAGNTTVVLTSDSQTPYDPTDAAKLEAWTQDLVKPTWEAINQAINNPPQLQKVSNFDAQVAGEMQRDALMALGLSLLVIMAYIWIRFGNLKYGTATVVAMLHDTLMVIGAVGLSHLIGNTWVGEHVLLVMPFRVNLTLVAAILTVMSYSMVDTIVVFDRIRENRGKFGHLSAKIVNDSINQTLSRTLLTAGTTVLTVFIMYLFGGAGIHGFTFVMLIGILVGTYSSIAIASPILLFGGVPDTTAEQGRPMQRKKQFQGA